MKLPRFTWQPVVLVALVVCTTAVLAWNLFNNLGSEDAFMPHAHCFLLKRDLILLHGVSDFLIGLSYVAISATLTYLVIRARREIPFHWMMLAFATFIVACGMTHFMEVWTLEHPNPPYWLSGNVKLVTALASVATAFLFPPLVPSILRLLGEARVSGERSRELERAHRELEGTHSALRDVHEKVKHFDELKTHFFTNVSHDLRTPLTLIIGPVDRLLESEKLDEAERRELKIVRRNALLLHRQVDDLLDASKLDAGKMQLSYKAVDLTRIVRLAADHFSSSGEGPHVLEVEAPESLPIEADAEKLQRVVLNLLSNACKFTPARGTVHVTVRAEGDDSAIFLVEDSGPGIPEHLRESIFQRFVQANTGNDRGGTGTGLGLSIVREFVELHHGRVSVEATSRGGAAFRVQLPRHAPKGTPVYTGADDGSYSSPFVESAERPVVLSVLPERIEDVPERPAKTDDRPIVLVAEDNPDMSEHIARTLGDDYEILVAGNGRVALEIAKKHVPDLILTDLMMPEMNGEELVAALGDLPALKDIPVILLTARADNEMKVNLLSSGARDYVLKPFAIGELRARVRNQITTKSVRDTLRKELASQEHDVAQLAKDIAERSRELVAARSHAEAASRAKDQFLAILSHELRTPLTPVLAIVTSLLEHLPTEPEIHQELRTVQRNVELEARLIDDLLDLTRIQRGKLRLHFSTVDAHSIIHTTIEMCEAEISRKAVGLELKLDAESHHLRADPARLLQIIWNLLLNAVKFTHREGRIVLQTFNDADQLIIAVIDDGVGIDAEAMAQIFEPFEQGERVSAHESGGLGLGLAVASGLVKAHGGTISAYSAQNSGRGATFQMRLQTSAAPAVGESGLEEARVTRAEVPAGHYRVLLVEDHDDTRRAVERLLTRWGYDVTPAGTLKEALDRAASANFHLLVSDLGLPDGYGTDVLSGVRQLHPEIQGIAMSGFGLEEDLRRTQEAGFLQHLVKPVSAAQLKSALEGIIAKL